MEKNITKATDENTIAMSVANMKMPANAKIELTILTKPFTDFTTLVHTIAIGTGITNASMAQNPIANSRVFDGLMVAHISRVDNVNT
jgi:hypothetical protein